MAVLKVGTVVPADMLLCGLCLCIGYAAKLLVKAEGSLIAKTAFVPCLYSLFCGFRAQQVCFRIVS